MHSITLSFVSKVTNGHAAQMRATQELLDRLRASWQATESRALSERYLELYRVVDLEISRAKEGIRSPIPCAQGCNHCCKFNRIFVSRAEAVLLVGYIESLPALQREAVLGRIRSAGADSGGGSVSPCVLLNSHGCSAYAARPLACRGYYSLAEPACRDRLEGRGGDPPNFLPMRVVEFAAMEVAEVAAEPPCDINALLRRIYEDPAKIEQWAEGHPTEEPDLRIEVRAASGR
jgi:Fe-S-cluster containining protein